MCGLTAHCCTEVRQPWKQQAECTAGARRGNCCGHQDRHKAWPALLCRRGAGERSGYARLVRAAWAKRRSASAHVHAASCSVHTGALRMQSSGATRGWCAWWTRPRVSRLSRLRGRSQQRAPAARSPLTIVRACTHHSTSRCAPTMFLCMVTRPSSVLRFACAGPAVGECCGDPARRLEAGCLHAVQALPQLRSSASVIAGCQVASMRTSGLGAWFGCACPLIPADLAHDIDIQRSSDALSRPADALIAPGRLRHPRHHSAAASACTVQAAVSISSHTSRLGSGPPWLERRAEPHMDDLIAPGRIRCHRHFLHQRQEGRPGVHLHAQARSLL